MIIDAKQILANWLMNHDTITTRELNKIAREIQDKLPSVCVAVSHYEVSEAIVDYQCMFTRVDGVTIGRSVGSEDRFEKDSVDLWFNDEIPEDVRKVFLEFFD